MLTALVLAVTLAPKPSLDPFLDDLSKRAFRYFWEQSNPRTGLTLDRANNTKEVPRADHVASIAATGFSLAALAIGAERGWIERRKALVRARSTVRALLDLPLRNRGWYVHFVDWETGERLWKSETSTIDSGILFAGLLLAERGFKDAEITSGTNRIVKEIDWNWMLTDGGAKKDSLTFTMGWHPESGFIGARWDGYVEQMLLYIIALGASEKVPTATWKAFKRPEVEYAGIRLLTGGPLFLHQMSHGFYDFKDKRDVLGYDYWVASRNATLANRRYCIDNPQKFEGYGPNIWGLSACDGPDGYNAFGAPNWISDNGTLAPAAAVASVPFTPKESTEAALAFRRKYPETLGRYGFTTGFNPTRKWQSPDVIGIDLGQMMLAIENYRDGLPQRLALSHPVNKRGMERAGFRKTAEGASEGRSLRVQP
ncbi:MAG: hypothetical protein KIS66_00555 [Fimbriimonadaceae bacterium]|nr:hypothetical protein [Fimbriimonadaceae bacterium]